MDKRPIGFMDSGVGGLTAVKEALRQLPNESMVFLGDQARMPYGPRTPQEVQRFSLQIAHFLEMQDIKLLVIACNTATAAALPVLQETLPIPVVGVIKAGSEQAVRQSQTGHIGVIATEGTINSQAYSQAISSLAPRAHVIGLACPEFVMAVEQNAYQAPATKALVADKLAVFKRQPVDTLVMGCTHFPLLRPFISAAMGLEVALIDSGAETVATVKAILTANDQLNDGQEPVFHRFYTTGQPAQFEAIAKAWLGIANLTATAISVAQLEKLG